jgi:hypothetical protein
MARKGAVPEQMISPQGEGQSSDVNGLSRTEYWNEGDWTCTLILSSRMHAASGTGEVGVLSLIRGPQKSSHPPRWGPGYGSQKG